MTPIRVRCPVCFGEPVVEPDDLELVSDGQWWQAVFVCPSCGPVVKNLDPPVVLALTSAGMRPTRLDEIHARVEAVRDIGDLGWST